MNNILIITILAFFTSTVLEAKWICTAQRHVGPRQTKPVGKKYVGMGLNQKKAYEQALQACSKGSTQAMCNAANSKVTKESNSKCIVTCKEEGEL